MKIVYVQVEKQKILQVAIGRFMYLTDEFTKESRDSVDGETSRAQSTNTRHAPASVQKNIEKANNMLSVGQCNPSTSKIGANLASSKSAEAGIKLKSQGDRKRPSSGSSSFFDR